jgi:predicted dehydrogenase
MRYAIIGSGAGIVQMHLLALNQLSNAQIVGMCDLSVERGKPHADALNVPFYNDHNQMLAETKPDIAVICTPHPFHANIASDAFSAGVHVLTEKPIAIKVSEADAMISAAQRAGKLLAVNFQQRFRPVIQKAKSLLQSGEMGDLVRVMCIEPWFRPMSYFRDVTWRGTWRGEGGGVLMNQAPHDLDLLCYMVGLPRKVWGWTRTLHHEIEAEDMAQAMFEFDNQAPGYLYTSTAEAGSPQRLTMVFQKGIVELSGATLTVTRFTPSLGEYIATSPLHYAPPLSTTETMEIVGNGGGHLAVYLDLEAAIREGRQPLAHGESARMGLELANAIIYSSFNDRAVTLPMDRVAYDDLLNKLQKR